MEPGRAVTVVVADDQRVVREGLAAMLALDPRLEVVGLADSAERALELVELLNPAVLLTDLRMPGIGGVEGIRRCHGRTPAVALTTYDDGSTVRAALEAGAVGFLNKDADAGTIVAAVLAAASGRSLLDPAALSALLSRSGADAGPDGGVGGGAVAGASPGARVAAGAGAGLTPREAEVLALVARGLSNDELARTLVLSRATIKTHLNHLLAKTGCRDRAALVAWAYREGITDG